MSKIINLNEDPNKMYMLGQGSKGNKVLLDGQYTIEDLFHIIDIMEKYANE